MPVLQQVGTSPVSHAPQRNPCAVPGGHREQILRRAVSPAGNGPKTGPWQRLAHLLQLPRWFCNFQWRKRCLKSWT